MSLDVNGERRQTGNTKTMIFGIAHCLHYISQFMVLEAGDVVTTGTPPGVALGMKPPKWLVPGDVMTLEDRRPRRAEEQGRARSRSDGAAGRRQRRQRKTRAGQGPARVFALLGQRAVRSRAYRRVGAARHRRASARRRSQVLDLAMLRGSTPPGRSSPCASRSSLSLREARSAAGPRLRGAGRRRLRGLPRGAPIEAVEQPALGQQHQRPAAALPISSTVSSRRAMRARIVGVAHG